MRSLDNARRTQSGSVVVEILVVTIFLMIIVLSIASLANSVSHRARLRILGLQAQYAAESGADSAIAQLNNISDTYTGTGSDVILTTNSQFKATYNVTVANGATSKERIITAVGKVYSPAGASTPTNTRTVRVTAQRSSTTTSSSLVSRNILDLQSGVKKVSGVDVYVNNYINMNKNTTDLIAENIIVGGKNTGAQNCSIGGSGNLIKPTVFTHPGQTKTSILAAYNNCITPPGNTSNANFDVAANQSTVTQVQSTYIPWSQYLDSSYTDAGSCSDWTTGGFPRTIPSAGNTKKTHYPNSSSGVVGSCGTSGNLTLGNGQYNITDHVHIRANLCSSSPCKPTFYNPTSTLLFIFVEGAVNFDSVNTAAGSGPIALVVYGSDPSSLTGACPLGGAMYLGNNGTTGAPALYLLASNGVCLDKTRFGASPALAGVSGKNIYIATNSGTPFDLALDPTFPVDQIPIDLAWRAIRYERL